jgi:hypothetical protein
MMEDLCRWAIFTSMDLRWEGIPGMSHSQIILVGFDKADGCVGNVLP